MLQAIFVVMMKITGGVGVVVGGRMYGTMIGNGKEFDEKMSYMTFEFGTVMSDYVTARFFFFFVEGWNKLQYMGCQ